MNPNPKVANGFKYLLLFTIFILLAFIILGFYYEQKNLREFAQSIAETNKSITDTTSKSNLNLNKSELDKVNSLFFQETNYQTNVKNDINIYANKAGIKISNYIFSDITSSRVGLQTAVVELKIQGSVEYNQLIQLLQYIENSLPKIQIINLHLEKDSGSKIIVREFKIEVYL